MIVHKNNRRYDYLDNKIKNYYKYYNKLPEKIIIYQISNFLGSCKQRVVIKNTIYLIQVVYTNDTMHLSPLFIALHPNYIIINGRYTKWL